MTDGNEYGDMKDCCSCHETAVRLASQRRVLWTVLAINAVAFLAEFTAGWWAGSVAVQADSLDNLGDASVYAVSLLVLQRSERERAWAAALKGVIQLLFGLAVLAEAAHRPFAASVTPIAPIMAIAAGGALIANVVCFALLMRHRSDDLNMRSVWLCSRNDVIGNAGTLVVAGLVALSGSRWPDIVFGIALALLFLHTSWQVLRDAYKVLRHAAIRA